MAFFRRVIPSRHFGPAGAGGSCSHALGAEDGSRYVVKFKENGQGLRVLVNELVAGGIARLLELPCPEGVIVELTAPFVQATKIEIGGRSVSQGLHFGTVDVTNGVYAQPPTRLIPQAANKDIFPLLVLFDMLTLNHDRNNAGNFLIVPPDAEAYDFYIVDHGHCFGNPAWDASITGKAGSWGRHVLPGVASNITGGDPFRAGIEKIQRILLDALIDGILAEVPPEWGASNAEMKALGGFIKGQRDSLANIATANRGLFPNWI